jgi:hypothetical protein
VHFQPEPLRCKTKQVYKGYASVLHEKPLSNIVEENFTWDILIPSTNDASASSFAQVLGKEEPEASLLAKGDFEWCLCLLWIRTGNR